MWIDFIVELKMSKVSRLWHSFHLFFLMWMFNFRYLTSMMKRRSSRISSCSLYQAFSSFCNMKIGIVNVRELFNNFSVFWSKVVYDFFNGSLIHRIIISQDYFLSWFCCSFFNGCNIFFYKCKFIFSRYHRVLRSGNVFYSCNISFYHSYILSESCDVFFYSCDIFVYNRGILFDSRDIILESSKVFFHNRHIFFHTCNTIFNSRSFILLRNTFSILNYLAFKMTRLAIPIIHPISWLCWQ
mmetsp:Transcript_15190/g.19259  ORF Transcript_15190/g.19259 Transcript_15190/m.19259 type:complete len:241 (+) Transcript_15190:66-788(+)